MKTTNVDTLTVLTTAKTRFGTKTAPAGRRGHVGETVAITGTATGSSLTAPRVAVPATHPAVSTANPSPPTS